MNCLPARRRYLLCGVATASILLGVVLTFSAPAATPAGFIVVVAMGLNSIGKMWPKEWSEIWGTSSPTCLSDQVLPDMI